MKKVLIPTDFSLESRYAVKYIINFFHELNSPCHITLLNAYLIPSNTNKKDIIELNDKIKKKSQEGLEKDFIYALKLIQSDIIKVETLSYMGSLTNVVISILQQKEVDLIAMGKDGGRHVEQISYLLKVAKPFRPPLIIIYK